MQTNNATAALAIGSKVSEKIDRYETRIGVVLKAENHDWSGLGEPEPCYLIDFPEYGKIWSRACRVKKSR
jgi:hypothetical protein